VFETLSARVYLLLGAGQPTLVDTGSGLGHSTHDIFVGLESVHHEFGESIRPNDIRCILISHGHGDHIGGLPELCQATHAKVVIHELDSAAVATYDEYVTLGNYRLKVFLIQAGVNSARRDELIKMSHFSGKRVEGVTVAKRLKDGDEFDGLRIIHTPGHSPGQVCVAVGNVLLSADHILARTIPQQWPESTLPYAGLGHYFDSLDKIQRIPGFEITLAAHEQVIHNVYDRIDAIRAAHQRRLDRLLATLHKIHRPLSVDQITKHLYPEVSGFRAVLAITDVGSRVEYLHQRGQLLIANLDEVQQEDSPIFRYVVS